MNNINKLLILSLITVCWSCTSDSKAEKHQNKRENIINVRDKVKEIKIDDVLIGPNTGLHLIGDYLIIGDYKSTDKLIHLFDRKNFNYVTSTANRGQGPDEITNMGYIGIDEVHQKFYVNDHGKQTIFSYELDSVLANPNYIPAVKMRMNEKQFPDIYQYVNDTLSIGLVIEPIGNADYKPTVAKWNMNTGEIKPMQYEHKDIKKKRISFAVSLENAIYVECYINHDLMTICSLDGNLKYNIYGPNWSSKNTHIYYYDRVSFCNDKIVVAYSGKNNSTNDIYSTKFLIFDINGNYIQTLETGYKIVDFCYDKENNRIILSLNDEIIQFAYIDIDGL
jgi:hypothetical protein